MRATTEPSAEADWQVLSRVAAGDSQAFATLVHRHEGRLLRLCERLLGDPEEARDAAQEVFLRVYRKAASATPQGQLFTWLYRIAVNLCFNRLRRRKLVRFVRIAEPGEAQMAAPEPIDPAPDGAAGLEARERWRATRRAIDRLPKTQRAVLVLTKFEGLSYRQVAAVLGISVGAVESRLFRAMRTLEREDGLYRQAVPEGE